MKKINLSAGTFLAIISFSIAGSVIYEPVSYTHLDVYKRQPHVFPEVRIAPQAPFIRRWLEQYCGRKFFWNIHGLAYLSANVKETPMCRAACSGYMPLSRKRRHTFYIFLSFAKYSFFILSELKTIFSISSAAVSYTHLDVYKRQLPASMKEETDLSFCTSNAAPYSLSQSFICSLPIWRSPLFFYFTYDIYAVSYTHLAAAIAVSSMTGFSKRGMVAAIASTSWSI